MLLFTINHAGHFGATMYWFGCLLSYYSFFTISYQVSMHVLQSSFYNSLYTLYSLLQAVFLDDSWILWVMNYMCEGYFLIEVHK